MAMPIDHKPFHVKRFLFTEEERACRGEFDLSRAAVNGALERGWASKFYNAELVYDVIQSPCSIWRGLRRFNFDTGYCYAGRAGYCVDDDGQDIPFPDNRLFLAFVRIDVHHAMLVFDWEFRGCDPSDPNIPVNAAIDFEEPVWSLKPARNR